MGLGFLFGMGKQKAKDAGKALNEAVVKWDPEAASEVQIQEMNDRFISLSEKVETARTEWRKEQHEADVISANYDKKKKAALILQGDLATLEGDAKTQTDSALSGLITELEELKPDVEVEVQEAVEAKQWLDDLEGDLKTFADKMTTARKQLAKAAKGMEKAARKEDKANERAKDAEERAGIRKETDAFDNVLNVMNANVDKAEAKASAADSRAKLLSKTDSADNSLVAAALARASGTDEKKSSADRLGAL